MVINSIEFPNEIIKALNEEKLVVFAGAGVSKNEPTKLPDFQELVDKIGKLCGVLYDSKACNMDEFLGDLARRGVNVHGYVSEILDDNDLKTNAYHKNILNLFKSHESIRIVTTNQDIMFEKAADEENIAISSYSSPAIPFGNDFTGIIHLHGDVKNPNNIIITDSDFGRAYMLNGYATGFLVDMFKSYTVLFIGYSYKDPIVRYLTSSIPSNILSKAYILSDNSNSSLIKRAGINIILYPSKSHQFASDAICKLGDYCRRGLFDWEKQINKLDLKSPPFDQETVDELLDGLSKPAVRKRLLRKIHNREWALFLNEKRVFDGLFDDSIIMNEELIAWGNWLIDNFLDKTLFELLMLHNNNINPHFCEMIIFKFINTDNIYSNELLIRYMVLFRSVKKSELYSYHLIDALHGRNLIAEAWGEFLSTIDYRMIIRKKTSYYKNEMTWEFKPKWFIRNEFYKFFWEKLFRKKVDNASHTIWVLTEVIQKLYYETSSLNGENGLFPLHFFDIEKSSWSGQDSELNIVCDILISALMQLVDESPKKAIQWLTQSVYSDQPTLIRRIGLIVLRKRKCISSSDVISLILSNFHLHEISEKEQLFKLIAVYFDEVDADLKQDLLDKIWSVDQTIIKEMDERNIYYIRYNWYHWLKKECKTCSQKIDDYLMKINVVYPEFKPREYPELNFGPIQTKWGHESPITSDALNQMSVEARYSFIKEYRTEDSFDGPTRSGLMSTVMDVCANDFNWGLDLLEKLALEKDYTSDMWNAVLRGLENEIDDSSVFFKVFNNFEIVNNIELAKACLQFINNAISNNNIRNELVENAEQYQSIVKYLIEMWKQQSVVERLSADWVTASLNSIAGIIANSLILLSCDLKNRRICSALKEFVYNADYNALEMPEFACVICEYSAQLNYCDREWFADNVLELLESENLEIQIAAWEGFLIGVKSFSPEFGEVMIPVFEQCKEVRKKLERDYYRKYIYDYALLFSYLINDPISDYAMPLIETDDDKVEFTNALGRIMRDMDYEQVKDIWEKWVKNYLHLRQKNIPSPITSSELTELLEWVFVVPDVEVVVNMITSINVNGTIKCDRLLFELGSQEKTIEHPEIIAKLLIYVNNHCDKGSKDVFSFVDIAKRLIDQGVDEATTEKLEEIMI